MIASEKLASAAGIRGLVPWILIGVGILHSIVGFSSSWPTLKEIAGEGFWNTVHTDESPASRPLILWFLVSGFMLVILGHLAWWVEKKMGHRLPVAFGVELLLFAIVIGVVMGGAIPAWFFGAAGIYVIVVAPKSTKSDEMESSV